MENREVIAQLTLRDDLTELEQELLDRLTRTQEELERLEASERILRLSIERQSSAVAA